MPQDYADIPLERITQPYGLDEPLEALVSTQFRCPQDSNLYPTHPQQYGKKYHRYDQRTFDRTALDGRDPQCLLSTVGDRRPDTRSTRSQEAIDRTIQRAEETGRRIPCQMADSEHDVIMSHTFIDACGNYYRGVWSEFFLGQYKSMGSLNSLGRTNYRVAGAVANERYDGDTYSVPVSSFLFLAELMPGDRDVIADQRAKAQSTHTLDSAGRLFVWSG